MSDESEAAAGQSSEFRVVKAYQLDNRKGGVVSVFREGALMGGTLYDTHVLPLCLCK